VVSALGGCCCSAARAVNVAAVRASPRARATILVISSPRSSPHPGFSRYRAYASPPNSRRIISERTRCRSRSRRSFTPDLGPDHCNDADDLRLRCQPIGIEIISRPGKMFAHAVEAAPEEMLSLLRRAPTIPAGRLVGADDGGQPRNGYDVAVLIDGSGFSQLAHRRACHDRGMWRATVAQASMPRARL